MLFRSRFMAVPEDRFIGSLGSIIIGDTDDCEQCEPAAFGEGTAAEDNVIELAVYGRMTDEEAGSRETG